MMSIPRIAESVLPRKILSVEFRENSDHQNTKERNRNSGNMNGGSPICPGSEGTRGYRNTKARYARNRFSLTRIPIPRNTDSKANCKGKESRVQMESRKKPEPIAKKICMMVGTIFKASLPLNRNVARD
jgi:hypothetical protein